MRHLILTLAASLMLGTAAASAQSVNLWLTTEGSGIQFSTGGHQHRCPPPPPPRHHKHGKKAAKRMHKKYKKMLKARHKYYKARNDFYRGPAPKWHHHHHDDDD
jgi:hypothetical protein